MNEPALVASGLARRFGQIRALRGVDLRLERGERLALFGANGAGKTTLLRILGLGLSPDAGGLSIDGLDPDRQALEARSRIGWLHHASLLYEDLSPRQNLEFWGRLYAVPQVAVRAGALIGEMGLTDYADEPVRILSRGLSQRLSLARALIHDPALLLLDEPFTGLDPPAVASLKRRLERRGQGQPSLVLATHRIEDGLSLSDRWILLSRGRVTASGRSAESTAAQVAEAYGARRPDP